MMIITTGLLRIVLVLALLAFTSASKVLTVQNSLHSAELKDAIAGFDNFELRFEGETKSRGVRSLRDEIDYRLPQLVIPQHYDLYLHPDIETGNFSGQEVITLSVLETTSQIILHAHTLTIKNVYVSGPTGANLEVSSFQLETVTEFLIINMANALQKDTTVRLGILFEAEMRDRNVGLYSSTYLTADDERQAIATSQFEPTYARQAFPCFDEPAMKATFDITLVRPTEGYHALSNMDEESSQYQGKYTEVRFTRSVPMSTYLACFIVSDLAHKTKVVNTNGIGTDFDIRIFATAHQLDKVDFALNTAVDVTEFYIQYYKVAYPLPKLDMAAIPDFQSNAMENWGIVTYRETALLYDTSFSSTLNKQRVAEVIAHELAHMWFGNLVTMSWWNDLWLNEGFARYMQYTGVHAVYPAWGMLDQILIYAVHSVMKYDSSVSSHPIIQVVDNPDQINEIFDTISYDKGAAVIRMLANVIGSEKFEQAVTNYLNNFQFKNAVTDDFITEIENVGVDFDVKLMMRTWTEQMGLPVVEVKRTSPTGFTLTQKRFFSNIDDYDNNYDDSEFNYRWNIPLTFYEDTDPSTVSAIWFDHDFEQLGISVPTTARYIKLNVQQAGYYRVNYEESIWAEIIADLVATPEKFAISDRAHLLNDIFALADGSQLPYDVALDMTTYLEKEFDFVPWYVAATKLQALQKSLVFTDTYVEYLKYARNLIEKVYKEVTWDIDEDDHLKNRLRVSILTAACALGLPDCLTEAASKFNAWLAQPENRPAPDVREIVYYYGMQRVGTQQSWDQVWQLFVAEKDASEKTKLMYGLSGVRVPWLLHRFIELAENENFVRRQDYFTCIQNIAANPVGEPLVWEYVREHWSDIVSRFGLNDRYMGRMIPSITGRFDSETMLEEMQEFFAKYPEAGAGTAARAEALQTVKYNIKWLEDNKNEVADWLLKHK